MSHTPHYDAAVAKILAETKPGERVCALTGEKWNMTEEEIGWYKKFNAPPLKICTNAVWKQLSYFDAGYQFWWNKHAESGKPVLSFHHPASGIKVLPDIEWYSKDFSTINQPVDWSRPFFGQLRDLEHQVPLLATFNRIEPENSVSLFSFGDRNSYFVLASNSENCFFTDGAFGVTGSSLLFACNQVTDSHFVLKGSRLFNCRYISESRDCINCTFAFDCRNCKDCFGVTNKRNGQYIFMNKQLTRGEYETKIKEIDLGKRSVVEKFLKIFDELLNKEGIWPENHNINSQDSSGDYLVNAVRCSRCFDSDDAAVDNFHSCWMRGASENNAFGWGLFDNLETYMCLSSPNSVKSKFLYRSIELDSCEYCLMCRNLKDCFGCVGLKDKHFHIFNRPYKEAEYWELVDKIKYAMLERGEYGNYLPVNMSSTYVPESGAVIFCAATDEDHKKFGGNIFSAEAEGAVVSSGSGFKPRSRLEVPDSIDDINEDWIGVPIFDEISKRTFSFLKSEIEHYKRLRIAPPNTHFIRRLHEVTCGGQLTIFEENYCKVCQKNLLVSKNLRYPNRQIYCQSCYLKYLEENN